jgi:UDP-N-acetylglucosamine diphosphorylase/glucosamine-1-phosphate N-acetyltransferase
MFEMEVAMNADIKAVVLAAGRGTRLRSGGGNTDIPKVMRLACGKPLLWYVLDALSFISSGDIIIVAGYKKTEVMDSFGGYTYAVQDEQLGTGHAVMAAAGSLSGFSGTVLVCYGDMPAVRRSTYEALISSHLEESNDCTILTGESSLGLPYGRIIRSDSGGFREIVEDRDCTAEQKLITELNSGVYAFRAPLLFDALTRVKRNNAQGEYYLTDVPSIMLAEKAKVGIHRRDLGDEILGVNTLEQLELVEEILRGR